MKKYISIIIAVLFCLITITQIDVLNIYAAASASVKPSASSVKIGDTFTVTVTFSGKGVKLGQADAFMTFDSNIIEYIEGDNTSCPTSGKVLIVIWDSSGKGKDSMSVSIKFKAKKAGNSALKATTTSIANMDMLPLANVTASSTVTVNTAPTQGPSTDANLKTLTVNHGTLSPKFAASTTSYTISVANSVSSIKVSATANNSKATVTGAGTFELEEGKSKTIEVKVTAESGAAKIYKIIVKREAVASPSPSSSPTIPSETTAETPTETPTITPSETPTETVATPTIPASTEIQSTTSDNSEGGMFSIRTAFIICAVGMFIMGGACGFIPAYIIKSKK